MSISGCVLQKKEMTKLWLDGKFVPVTLLSFVSQVVDRYTSVEKDGVQAAVLSVFSSPDAVRTVMKKQFVVTNAFVASNDIGAALSINLFDGCDTITLTGVSKGKGFQGNVKRNNFSGGPKTHGSKFHKGQGSTGRRKPRRTEKGFPMAGRMGNDTITLRGKKVVKIVEHDNTSFIAVKGSVPGGYNSYVFISFENTVDGDRNV